MPKYRAVMATTVDCEGCMYDAEEGCAAEYCVLLDCTRKHDDVGIRTPEECVGRIIELLRERGV